MRVSRLTRAVVGVCRGKHTTSRAPLRNHRRTGAMKHPKLPTFTFRASSVEHGETAASLLVKRGADARAVEEMLLRHPEVNAYDCATEIAPRMSYLEFLERGGELGSETAAALALRQPGILERKYETVYECFDKAYIAVNKPFAVRLDTPRGWTESDADGNVTEKKRFEPRWEGDASCEDWLNATYPNMHHRFCHQLDTATSGVILTAHTKSAAAAAAKLFRDRKAKKTYLAVVYGWPERDEWTTTAKLGKDPNCPKGFRERVDEEGGKASETRFKVLRRGYCTLDGAHRGIKVTLLQCKPVTGRRHQIRVHLQHSGFPILGDIAYYSGVSDSFRMFLHALELVMPFPDETLTFKTDPPLAFELVVSADPPIEQRQIN
ncbi:pseudouridylate synthase, 23S RNA-specific [Ostreococcus tauri]|uniref:Pseudouridylate synthase, 23S RNA-specific n=3 Tax=Ostreococcus tauri TaxID=70448 RepID=A0A1Y5ILB9_OSTTA|nr:pseudouridylate synthase, 23S RNA-specific [Ostreococcus tauri]